MMNSNNRYDVIVLGAGAAGLMCALTAGQRGLKVLVLEKSNKPGKKILMSGGGRCNFTNLHTSPDNFISANPHYCKSALSRYTPWHFIELVEKHQIPYHEKELGQLFCDRSSKDILNMLLDECAAVQVDIRLNVNMAACELSDTISCNTTAGDFIGSQLVVATGGLSIPKMGGSDFGYQLAAELGLTIKPKQAALVPFVFTDQYKALFTRLAGAAVMAEVRVVDGTVANRDIRFKHQVLFTHRGLSGPAILQISSYWRLGQSIEINLLPEQDAEAALLSAKSAQPQIKLNQWLGQFLPKKVAYEITAYECPEWHDQSLQSLSNANIMAVAQRFNSWQLKPSGTEGYRTAEVTSGGVDTDALSSKTMAVKTRPNVYFIGEVVDVTGHLGGFNFQWAWASAFVAGQSLTAS